jgi:hypothetical protein
MVAGYIVQEANEEGKQYADRGDQEIAAIQLGE